MPHPPAESSHHRAGPDETPAGGGGRRDDAALLIYRTLSRTDLLTVFSEVADAAASGLDIDRVSLWHYDRQRTVLLCAAVWDRGVIAQESLVLAADVYPDYWTQMHATRTHVVHDVEAQAGLASLHGSYLGPHGVGALMGCRVGIDGGTFGVLAFEHRGGAREWTPLEQRFAESMAERLGLALHVQAQRRVDSTSVQARRMEALALMAGRIAHAFNNTLSVILSTASAARALQSRGKDIAEDLDAIEAAVQQATGLTRKLLYFGRPEPATRDRVDLNDALRQASEQVAPSLPPSIRLQVLPDALPLVVEAEQAFVGQALQTLCTNAVESMPNGGSLTLASRRLATDGSRLTHGVALPPGRYAHVRVLDGGEGIPPDALSRVFEPFYTTRGRSHAGLGLSLVYGGMRQHDGFVGVESVVGRGTVFHLFFPLHDDVG